MTYRRLGYAILGLAMTFFAWLQVNDPDPLLWLPLYATAAVLLFAAVFGWWRRSAVILAWVSYAVVGAFAMPGFVEWLLHHPWSDLAGVMSPERQYIEDSRELLGLLIAAACLLFLWWAPPSVADRRPRRTRSVCAEPPIGGRGGRNC